MKAFIRSHRAVSLVLALLVAGSVLGTTAYNVFSPGGALSGTWNLQSVNLGSGAYITGNLPVARLNNGTGAASNTYWSGAATWTTPAGAGDVTGPASSVDSELALFSGTGGKTIKRATGSGIPLLTSGVLSIATAGTNYYAPGSTDVAFADGGTGLSSAADDTVLVSNGSAWQAKALNDCPDTGGNHLNYIASTNTIGCGTSGTGGSVAGSNTQIQFNDSGAFGADADFNWAKTTNILTLGSSAAPTTITPPTAAAAVSGIPLTIQAGTGGSGSSLGGDLIVQAGSGGSTDGVGGSLTLKGGTQAGSGSRGNIYLQSPTEFMIDSTGAWFILSNYGSVGQTLLSSGGSGPPSWGSLGVAGGGLGLSSLTQGDIVYASASNTVSALAKNTSATRYLSNTGTSNNPAWAQVNLANGVAGTLPATAVGAVPNWTSNAQNTNYTFVLADAGKQVLHANSDSTARTYTVPPNSSVAFVIGTTIMLVDDSAAGGADTLAQGAGVTIVLGGTATTGNRTIAVGGIVFVTKTATNRWIVWGNGVT